MKHVLYFTVGILAAGIVACTPAGGEKRGHEFMPDMVHSTAYEANIYEYYYYNKWGTEDEYKQFAMPRKSVPGTIPRGEVSVALQPTPGDRLNAYAQFEGGGSPSSIAYHANGAVPYPYADTDADRVRASNEIGANPFPITNANLEHGKALYVVYCGVCHGEKGDGLGYLVREADPAKGIVAGVYPAAPANFLKEAFLDTTNGFFYHSIMYGKNMMGPYADKLSYSERWQVIQYIRSLQAKAKGAVYTEDANTYNSDVPGGPLMKQMAEAKALTPALPDSTHANQTVPSHLEGEEVHGHEKKEEEGHGH